MTKHLSTTAARGKGNLADRGFLSPRRTDKSRRACYTSCLLFLLVLCPVLPAPALADIYVLESTDPKIRAGTALKDDDQMVVSSGASIRAVLPNGKTQTIRGPFQGQVKELTKNVGTNEGVTGWLKNMLGTGGARESMPGGIEHRPGGCPDPPCADTKPGQGEKPVNSGAPR